MMKYKHECPEWDFMEIDETCSEIMCCLCFDDDEFNRITKKFMQELDEVNNKKEEELYKNMLSPLEMKLKMVIEGLYKEAVEMDKRESLE